MPTTMAKAASDPARATPRKKRWVDPRSRSIQAWGSTLWRGRDRGRPCRACASTWIKARTWLPQSEPWTCRRLAAAWTTSSDKVRAKAAVAWVAVSMDLALAWRRSTIR